MRAKLNMQEKPLSWLKPAEYNPRVDLKPGDPEYENIKRSIETFTYVDPIIANVDGVIIGGHQRLKVLKDLGYDSADVVIVDKDKDEEKTLNVILNNVKGEWDPKKLAQVIGEIDTSGLDATLTGFNEQQIKKMVGSISMDWFDRQEKDADSRQEGNDEYNDFLDKFEPKKTTDDCYTPDNIYDAVCGWVEKEYGLDRSHFVRPFYPGGDYQAEDYAADAVVVDNPPFSILSEIASFYNEKDVRFFLFAPALTLLSNSIIDAGTAVCASCIITYENGAKVNTSFITNLEDSEILLRTAPELREIVNEVNRRNQAEISKQLPKYQYPDYILTAAMANKWSHYGIDYMVKRSECARIEAMDMQRENGKAIFGKGLLLSEKAAAEKAAAEKAAAEKAAAKKAAEQEEVVEKWQLSEREWEIVKSLGGDQDGREQ